MDPQVGDVDQAEVAARSQDNVTQMKRTEVDAGVVEPGDETAEPRLKPPGVRAGADELTECLPLQRPVVHGVAADAANPENVHDVGTGDTPLRKRDRIVREPLRIGIPGGRGDQALAAEQLEVAAVGQPEHLFAVPVPLEYHGVGAHGEVIVMFERPQAVAAVHPMLAFYPVRIRASCKPTIRALPRR